MSEPAERRIGSVIAGKWRVDALLGSGSMAAVYAVTHRNGARAALKVLHPTLCADETVCERFLGEGYLTNSVKHPGIVRVHDDGMAYDGSVFLVMDLLEGRTLEKFRQEQGGRIELTVLLDIADELMDILTAVHRAGIIHRDLKPQNVFLCNDGSVKLLDFGVAHADSVERNGSLFNMVLGTPSFMSPEQAVGARDQLDQRSDVWSLGATMFTGLTGETVHLGPHVQAKLLAAATAKARSIALVNQELPKPVAAVIDTALRFNKEDRWQSVDAFRRALRDTRAQLGLGAPVSLPSEWLNDATDPTISLRIQGVTKDGEAILAPDSVSQSMPHSIGQSHRKRSRSKKGRKSVTSKTLIGVGGPEQPALTKPPANGSSIAPVARDTDRLPAAPNESAEGSIPAASTTMNLGEDDALLAQVLGRPRAGSIWLIACALALVAGAGIALFTMQRPADQTPTESATGVQPSDTSATGSSFEPSMQPVTAPMRTDGKEPQKDASTSTGAPIKAQLTTPQQLRMAHATEPPVGWTHSREGAATRTSGVPTQPTPTKDPAPPAIQDPPPPPPASVSASAPAQAPTPVPAPAASDPFSTPE